MRLSSDSEGDAGKRGFTGAVPTALAPPNPFHPKSRKRLHPHRVQGGEWRLRAAHSRSERTLLHRSSSETYLQNREPCAGTQISRRNEQGTLVCGRPSPRPSRGAGSGRKPWVPAPSPQAQLESRSQDPAGKGRGEGRQEPGHGFDPSGGKAHILT